MNQAVRKHPKKHTAPRRTNETKHEDDSPALFVRKALKSLLWSVGVGTVSCLIAALVAYFCPNPGRAILPLGLAASALTAFLGGIIAIRVQGHGALPVGLTNGALLTALMILASLFLKPLASGYATWLSLLMHVAFLALSVAGAAVGRKRTPGRRRK